MNQSAPGREVDIPVMQDRKCGKVAYLEVWLLEAFAADVQRRSSRRQGLTSVVVVEREMQLDARQFEVALSFQPFGDVTRFCQTLAAEVEDERVFSPENGRGLPEHLGAGEQKARKLWIGAGALTSQEKIAVLVVLLDRDTERVADEWRWGHEDKSINFVEQLAREP